MEYEVLASGSGGNCVILNRVIALDMGVPLKTVRPYLQELQIVFCSHAHQDHINPATIRAIASQRPTVRFCGGEWMAGEFIRAGVPARRIDVLEAGKRYDYGAFSMEPFDLHHDVPNLGLKIYIGGEKALYAVDTGYIRDVAARNFDLYLLECNHTEAEIKARIYDKQSRGEFAYESRAARYHLSQEQAVEWLLENMGENSRYQLLHQHDSAKEEWGK